LPLWVWVALPRRYFISNFEAEHEAMTIMPLSSSLLQQCKLVLGYTASLGFHLQPTCQF
jgi:hypothetical protein